ncbi:M1 family metallopeptidase [Massilia sp. TS11]|uniref:M1 family metallopeptidase n=1 Tax=Massilia sp. TS11 TaxID=2908003 RepID=UPI001EDBE186|nr:M1 family metallopeptidase [Massilia sp. TS11]MCG2584012.1 M1 family metallopeptidase [Massilia sp. TS11]
MPITATLLPRLALGLLLAHATCVWATPSQLPGGVRPEHYALLLKPDAKALRFAAEADIRLVVERPTRSITLHALDLEIGAVRLDGRRRPQRITLNPQRQTLRLDFAAPLKPGRHQLHLDYRGQIGQQTIGLFALDDEEGRRALFTQFENSDARRLLPSWDEPNFKASFALRAIVPADDLAVSNMPVAARTILPDGRAEVRFADTPRMSTYLLFFASGPLERVSAQVGPTDVGVITTRGRAQQARFVLDATTRLLTEYNDYFGLPYPLPKLDNVAAPGRNPFFGAMENWGAIFTFEHAMLLDPAISTAADKQEVFATAAHEIAHQWFGDLVTMRWWDDLWLNEGFASWMESRMLERLHPEWETRLGTIALRDEAMAVDALAGAHPVVQRINTVEQANQAFDNITYRKGEAVIRMLEAYVGEETWRDGIRIYLREHRYGNTVSDDLWRAVEQAARKPVRAIAHDFTLQAGVPLVRLASAECVDGSTRARLLQEEFQREPRPGPARRWRVPVVVSVLGQAPVRTLLEGGAATLTLPGCGPLLLNAGQAGYYRSAYPAPALSALAERFASLPPLDQLGLLSDSWALGLAGQQPMARALDLLHAVPANANAQVWGRVAEAMLALGVQLRGQDAALERLRHYASARLAPRLRVLGWAPRAGEPDTDTTLRAQLIDTLGGLGDPATVTEARLLFEASRLNPSALPTALRKAVLGVVALHADAASWEQLLAVARAETSALAKGTLYDLLATSADPALARRALDLSLSAEVAPTQTASMISAVAVLHPELAFSFASARQQEVDARLDASSRSRFYPMLAATSADPAMIARLRQFASAQFSAEARQDTESAVAQIEGRIQMRRARLPEVDAWLRTHGGP